MRKFIKTNNKKYVISGRFIVNGMYFFSIYSACMNRWQNEKDYITSTLSIVLREIWEVRTWEGIWEFSQRILMKMFVVDENGWDPAWGQLEISVSLMPRKPFPLFLTSRLGHFKSNLTHWYVY